MALIITLAITIVLQFFAASVAVKLTKVTKYNLSWILISFGFVFMAVQRLAEILPFITNLESQYFRLFYIWLGAITSLFFAIGVFLLISVYFFFFAGKTKVEQRRVVLKNKKGYFLSGMLLSLINLFPIPFYVVLSVTFSSYNWFSFEKIFLGMFALGASSGAMLAFYGYIVFIQKIESRTDFFMKNVNYLIGSITLIIALIGIIKLM